MKRNEHIKFSMYCCKIYISDQERGYLKQNFLQTMGLIQMVFKMRNKIRILLENIGYFTLALGKYIYLSEQEKRVKPWFNDQGDQTLRLNYDLDKKSIVFDLGGYQGQWTSDIFSKYCCVIHIFEPAPLFTNIIKKRFEKNSKIYIHEFGLADKSCKIKVALAEDGTSMFKNNDASAEITLIKAIDFFQENQIKKIDLMKINIEGGEYDLLEHLIESEFISNIKNIQVQFHDFVPNAKQKMLRIQKRLRNTHKLTFQYEFIWENWKLINKG